MQSGVASLSLQAIAQDPVGNYTLACSYAGSGNYAASSASPIPFSIMTQGYDNNDPLSRPVFRAIWNLTGRDGHGYNEWRCYPHGFCHL